MPIIIITRWNEDPVPQQENLASPLLGPTQRPLYLPYWKIFQTKSRLDFDKDLARSFPCQFESSRIVYDVSFFIALRPRLWSTREGEVRNPAV